MTEGRRAFQASRRALLLAGAAAALPLRAQPQQPFRLGLLTQGDDERYSPQTLLRGFPDAPGGRSEPAAQIALNDSLVTLQMAGRNGAELVALEAPAAADLPATLQQLLQQRVQHVVLELPAPGVAAVAAAARGKDVMLFNAAAPEDALRAAQCATNLLHTLPSHAMQMDAIAQLLVARKWSKPLVLVGPTPGDRLLQAAWQRSAKRFAVRPVAERSFKLSNDPRERELGNVRLLTSERDYDAVVVLDAQGEFAQGVPYRTVLPRPVLGSNGLVAQAWSPFHERNGGPQLTRRFLRRANRWMTSYDWATWMAARCAAEVAGAYIKAGIAQQVQALRQGAVAVDGYKGQRLTFRAWDGQLRQPLLLAYGGGVADVAPLEGFLHPRITLDTLGYDAPETGCKAS
ncbi:type 1 periplasmic-binding domain-containing protein [Ramlibacter alkalitolerans]|uniref:Branched-chain amino acid ABC transporter substrate-binding protein n=1 Tax=Ramlibacter alkalitolerans TaxID=2039631 RepID=A0ABS1JNE7_9BURK|nr:branched-chain amino acid ABC transporter substrate-binding protein [Ramlibacter alkalitolerans]MBL0425748.1 branched-chain amino acid ABC transporter substrate-binding protein [Ramlibacter alkalitolerans]